MIIIIIRFTKKKFEREARERNEANNNSSVTLVAGLRQFHESGPELKRTISGHLNEILDADEPSTRRNLSFFGGEDSTRRNIAFFGAAGPAFVQVRRLVRRTSKSWSYQYNKSVVWSAVYKVELNLKCGGKHQVYFHLSFKI